MRKEKNLLMCILVGSRSSTSRSEGYVPSRSSVQHRGHQITAPPRFYSSLKKTAVIGIAAFTIPLTIIFCTKSPEDRQAWAAANAKFHNRYLESIAQIFSTLRELLLR